MFHKERRRCLKKMLNCIQISFRGKKCGVDLTMLSLYLIYFQEYKHYLGLTDTTESTDVDSAVAKDLGLSRRKGKTLRILRNKIAHLYETEIAYGELDYLKDDIREFMFNEMQLLDDVVKYIEGVFYREKRK